MNPVATCIINGQQVPCGEFQGLANILPFLFIAILVIGVAFAVLGIISSWKIFTKAGKPGWAAIVPIYNFIIMLEIVRKPTWWVLLAFIPIVPLVISIIVIYELAVVFGKKFGFFLGLLFLPFIFFPILAFGKSTYLPVDQTQPLL